jgi:hypothetical protein
MPANLSSRSSYKPIMATLLALTFAVMPAFPTAQEGDVLILDGKQYNLQTNPLNPYLEQNPGRLPKSDVVSSSNWRGYIATWEVKGGQLLLKDIHVAVSKKDSKTFETEDRSVIEKVFSQKPPIVAEWFTGNLIIPTGDLKSYVHMGYASTYDNYIILTIRKGLIARRWDANQSAFKKFRASQFAEFQKTTVYKKALHEVSSGKDPMNQNDANEFIRQYYSEEYMSRIFDSSR